MSSIYTIYKATNRTNGKSYIGFDSAWPKRKIAHLTVAKQGKGFSLQRAIRKYGQDAFDWEIIYQSKDKEHTLNEMEEYFIQYYDSRKNGYNIALGGSAPTIGLKFPNKAPITQDHKEKIRNSLIGHKHTDITKEKMSKKYLIENIILNTKIEIINLKKWCLNNKQSLGKIRGAVREKHTTKDGFKITKIT